ncbi:hypothetical protein [Anaerosinus massiliensis]|uniref:hypothetical protein n=1 Tax=Massilibacillus massiliensis TaxID=1806837 RepID=UPI000DA5FC12|nr:hypothetical protein [Massilibacillus massiliensis]
MAEVDDKTAKMEKIVITPKKPVENDFSRNVPRKDVKLKSKKKLAVVMTVLFVMASLLGYFTLSYYYEKQDIAENKRIHNQHQGPTASKDRSVTTESKLPEMQDLKNKTEKYIEETTARTDKVKDTVHAVKASGETVAAAVQDTQDSSKKVQSFIEEHRDVIDQVTQFIETQKNHLSAFFSKQNEASKENKSR